MSASLLAPAFLERLSPARRAAFAGAAELEGTLRRLIDAAAEAWPGVAVPPEEVVAHLARVLEDGPAGTPGLSAVQAPDLYLALACGRGDRAALAKFEAQLLPAIVPAIARIDPSPQFVDEVKQLLRQHLLAHDGARPPRMLEYAGRGPLLSWMRAAALRTALNHKRDERPRALSDSGLMAVPSEGLDPELTALKGAARAEFLAAFRAALGALEPRERLLLKLSHVDGLGVEQIARHQRVHRTTITRWMAEARSKLVSGTREELAARLKLAPDELESLIRTLRSNLDLTLSRVFLEEP